MTTSSVFNRTYNSTTATVLDLFTSSSTDAADDETTLRRRSSTAAVIGERTGSSKPQLDTSTVWHRSSIYATFSRKTITTPVATTGNNTTDAAAFSAATNGAGSVSTAPMTRFSGSSADVISSTQPAAAATTTTLSLSLETTRRPFEPSVYAGAATTTKPRFFTDVGIRATTDTLSEWHLYTHTNRRFLYCSVFAIYTRPESKRSWHIASILRFAWYSPPLHSSVTDAKFWPLVHRQFLLKFHVKFK